MKKLIIILSFLPLLSMAQDVRTITHDRTTAIDDYANIFSQDEKAKLNAQIGRFFDTVQISVVTIPTIEQYDISEEAVSLANRWGIGSKSNNGLLLLISVQDHKMFAATGKTIQGDITDLQASRLQREIAVPLFKQHRYFEGTRDLLSAYIDLLSPSGKEYRRAQQAIADRESAETWAIVGWTSLIAAPFLLFGIILLIRKNKRKRQEREELEQAQQRQYAALKESGPGRPGNFLVGYALGSIASGHSSSASSGSSSSSSSSDYGSSNSSYDIGSSSSDSGSSSSYDFGGGSFDGGGGGSSW